MVGVNKRQREAERRRETQKEAENGGKSEGLYHGYLGTLDTLSHSHSEIWGTWGEPEQDQNVECMILPVRATLLGSWILVHEVMDVVGPT